MKTEFHVSHNSVFRAWQFHIIQRNFGVGDGGQDIEVVKVAKPLEFYQPNPNVMPEPALEVSHEEIQTLMDTLWNQGVRPSGETQADNDNLRAHLDDMRAIVAATTAIKLRGHGGTNGSI